MGFHTLVYHEVRDSFDWSSRATSKLITENGYSDQLPQALFVTVQDFIEQMLYLKENDFHFLSLSEVKDFYELDTVLPDKSILITVDDAFQSFYYNAYPILKELKIKAALFLVSGWLFEKASEFDQTHSKVMSKVELFKMNDMLELANHSDNLHNRPGERMNGVMTATKKELQDDLALCNKLVDHTDTFAYPFGFYNQHALEILSDSGIHYSFTTQPGLNTKETPRLELHRFLVHNHCSLDIFKEYVETY